MLKTNVYDLTTRMFKTKQIEIALCTHYKSTGAEKWETVTKVNTKEDKHATSDTYAFKDCEVIMFEPVKKGHLKIWAIRYEE